MSMDFLSDTPWQAFTCSHQSQNGEASQWNCACNSVGLHDSFYYSHRYDTDAPHDTEIQPWICKNTNSESVYNKSQL
jgi:hypothetical protein